MRLRKNACLRSNRSTTPGQVALLALGMTLAILLPANGIEAQAVSTTTVQGTVYLANGQPGTGLVLLSWPAFMTAQGQAITAGTTTAAIATDGFLSVNLTPNQGASPAGLYYTAVYHLSDGTTSTEYWVVPVAAQASLSSVRARVMPAAQAVQTVSKAYVDQEIQELTQSLLTASGGTLSGPLYLNGDPVQPLQAADKHYVDSAFAEALPLTGGTLTGPLTAVQLGAAFQVDQFPGADFGAKLAACLGNLDSSNGGTCDARNFTGAQSMGANLTISTPDATVLLPCTPISTTHQIVVTAGTRNVALRGCAFRGTNAASGAQGGTVLLYSGTGAAIQAGDPTYAVDTQGFHLDNVAINITASASANAQALTAFRSQEMDIENVYLLGNSNQTGMTLDGTGNYTGGTFLDVDLNGFQQGVNAVGHQIANPATTDWLNASTFVRLHIDCPTSGGSPIAGTFGINLQQGDGNTFTGGDVEGCDVALHLGANAQNNTVVGLRNENSNNQVVADTGSAYNNWMTGGTMFTGKLTDNGTRNSFLDTFHRSFNGIKGDWYGSQQDATVTNHFRLGIGAGNERGLLDRYQSDFGYRWTTGLSDAAAGEQFYQILDELNNVYRVSIGQFNNGQSSTNNQTVINAAGTGAVVLNGSNNSGTGGVVFGSGGSAENTVATISSQGNAQFNGTLQVGGASTFVGSTTAKNQADAEIDAFLWAGATTGQKEAFTYKDWNGNSQWYMVKDASNNWALNSATGGLDSIKAYQSTNSGDTYINASNATGHIRLNYEAGSGAETDIYAGSSGSLAAAFLGTTAIKFPGLAAASGHSCMQIDTSGYLSNTGAVCGAGGSGTVNAGSTGQIAYYTGNGTVIAGTSAVPIVAGGTGASSASAALASLGAQPAMAGVAGDGAKGLAVAGIVAAGGKALSSPVNVLQYGAQCDGVTDDSAALTVAFQSESSLIFPPGKTCVVSSYINYSSNVTVGTLLFVPVVDLNGSTILFTGTGNSIIPWPTSTAVSVGTVVISGGYAQVVTTAGTTGSSAPTWGTSWKSTTADGTAIWTNNGLAPYQWIANTPYYFGEKATDGRYLYQVSISGITGSATPVWNTAAGTTTTDGTVSWVNLGPGPTNAGCGKGVNGLLRINTQIDIENGSLTTNNTAATCIINFSGSGGAFVGALSIDNVAFSQLTPAGGIPTVLTNTDAISSTYSGVVRVSGDRFRGSLGRSIVCGDWGQLSGTDECDEWNIHGNFFAQMMHSYPKFAVSTPVSLGSIYAGDGTFAVQVTTAGTTGASSPVWPTTAGSTVTSGTAVFTTLAIPARYDPEVYIYSPQHASIKDNYVEYGPFVSSETTTGNSDQLTVDGMWGGDSSPAYWVHFEGGMVDISNLWAYNSAANQAYTNDINVQANSACTITGNSFNFSSTGIYARCHVGTTGAGTISGNKIGSATVGIDIGANTTVSSNRVLSARGIAVNGANNLIGPNEFESTGSDGGMVY